MVSELWSIIANLSLITVNLVLALLFWFSHRIPIYRNYAIYWILGPLNFLGQGIAGDNVNLAIILFAFAGIQILVMMLLTSSLFAVGSKVRSDAAVLGLGIAVSLIGIQFEWPIWLRAMPVCIAPSWMLFSKSRQIMQAKKRLNIEEKIFLATLLVLCLHIMDYPWLRFSESGIFFGFLVAIMLGSTFSIITTTLMATRVQETYASNLEAEVSHKTRELAETLEQKKALLDLVSQNLAQAETTAEMKGRLLQVVSHDISNPLGVARNFAELALNQANAEHLKKVVWALDEVMNIMKYSSVSQSLSMGKTVVMGPVDVEDMFKQLRLLFSHKAREKGISLSFSVEKAPMFVMAEKVSLTYQVFANLISNCIKFSAGGAEVKIEARAKGKLAHFVIQDRGIGMSQDLLRGLFDPSTNVSRPGTSGELGSGYGMPLVAAYVQILKGQLEVTSVAREENPEMAGTTFALTFLLAEA